jgi:hypothetical protein
MSFPELVGADKFAQGKLTYSDHLGNESRIARIVVTAVFGHNVPITAIVDTGAPWCIVGPEEAEGIDPNYLDDGVPGNETLVRGNWYQGNLYRVPVTLVDENRGTDVTVEATVFIPTLRSDEKWPHPNFLGLDGFLNRLRFAVDPSENAFYFGEITE